MLSVGPVVDFKRSWPRPRMGGVLTVLLVTHHSSASPRFLVSGSSRPSRFARPLLRPRRLRTPPCRAAAGTLFARSPAAPSRPVLWVAGGRSVPWPRSGARPCSAGCELPFASYVRRRGHLDGAVACPDPARRAQGVADRVRRPVAKLSRFDSFVVRNASQFFAHRLADCLPQGLGRGWQCQDRWRHSSSDGGTIAHLLSSRRSVALVGRRVSTVCDSPPCGRKRRRRPAVRLHRPGLVGGSIPLEEPYGVSSSSDLVPDPRPACG